MYWLRSCDGSVLLSWSVTFPKLVTPPGVPSLPELLSFFSVGVWGRGNTVGGEWGSVMLFVDGQWQK